MFKSQCSLLCVVQLISVDVSPVFVHEVQCDRISFNLPTGIAVIFVDRNYPLARCFQATTLSTSSHLCVNV